MDHSSARPPRTPSRAPTPICSTNSPPTRAKAPAPRPPAATRLAMRAMPTGSLAPDSPSSTVPLRPETSRCPSTENTTAGSVGATAVPTSRARYHSRPKARCASTAAAAAVRKVPATPMYPIGAAAARNRARPMCMPPSNRMHRSASVTIRSTVRSGGACSAGTTRTATAAAARNSAGAGMRMCALSRLDSTARRPAAEVRATSRANGCASFTAGPPGGKAGRVGHTADQTSRRTRPDGTGLFRPCRRGPAVSG